MERNDGGQGDDAFASLVAFLAATLSFDIALQTAKTLDDDIARCWTMLQPHKLTMGLGAEPMAALFARGLYLAGAVPLVSTL